MSKGMTITCPYIIIFEHTYPGEGGRLNAVGNIHQITGVEFPATYPRFTLLVGISPDAGTDTLVEIIFRRRGDKEPGKVIATVPNTVIWEALQAARTLTFSIQVKVENLVFPVPGVYEFVVRAENREIGVLPLRVRQEDAD